MSKSIHITRKNFKGLTKEELDQQTNNLTSDLSQWGNKSILKETIKRERKERKSKLTT